jgi:hypothetical protein
MHYVLHRTDKEASNANDDHSDSNDDDDDDDDSDDNNNIVSIWMSQYKHILRVLALTKRSA